MEVVELLGRVGRVFALLRPRSSGTDQSLSDTVSSVTEHAEPETPEPRHVRMEASEQ